MADDILKNEFMWEAKQEKKKLYKNWKFYASALGIIVIGAGTSLGIYYGINATNHSKLNELIDLNNLNLNKTISGTENMTQDEAYQIFLDLNQEKYPDLKDNIEVGTFTAPTYNTTGKLIINASTTSKYNGTITITINEIGQISLKNLELNTTISGKENITQEDAFRAFLDLNQEKYPDLEGNVEIGTFTAPTHTATGKLIINAKADGKYKDNITITITIKYSDEEIGEAISKLTYPTDIEAGSSYQELQARIKTINYKIQLSEEFKNQFNAKFLTIGDIKKENNAKVTNEDLKNPTTSTLKSFTVDFAYNNYQGTFNLQLTILKVTTPEDKQNINEAIKNHLYQGIALLNTPVSELITLISNNDFDFIKKELPTILQSKFRAQYFEFGKVYLGNQELQNSDLAVVHDQNNPLNIQVEFKYPNSNISYDRFNAKLIVIDEPQAIEKYSIVQKELTFIDARDIPNNTETTANEKKRAYEQIKTILEKHNLEFNQEQWILSYYEYPRNPSYYYRTDILITYLSFPTFNREVVSNVGEIPEQSEFNNLVQEALKDYQFQNLANYEQEIKNIITTIREKFESWKQPSLKVSEWKITKKDGYIEVWYQPRGGMWWIYEPIQVPYN